jgi:peptide/histidine transporter 3/4
MDRSIGSHFQVPPVSLVAFSTISGLVFMSIYDRFVVSLARRITGHEGGLTVLQRIGIGMFFLVLYMMTATLIEKKRTHVEKIHGLLDMPKTPIPINVFWLTPQFVLVGIAKLFTLVALQEYFYSEAPHYRSIFVVKP